MRQPRRNLAPRPFSRKRIFLAIRAIIYLVHFFLPYSSHMHGNYWILRAKAPIFVQRTSPLCGVGYSAEKVVFFSGNDVQMNRYEYGFHFSDRRLRCALGTLLHTPSSSWMEYP